MQNTLKFVIASILRILAKLSPKQSANLAWSIFCRPLNRKKPLSNSEEKLIQQSQQFFIDSDEYRIAVYRWNAVEDADLAKAILLTHGWGGHALNFSYIIKRLLADGFNVIAFDGPAHGNSSGKQANLLLNTQALLALTEHIPSIDALVGHSFGAITNAYALDLANYGDPLENVNKIVLVSGPNRLADIFAAFIQAMQLPEIILEIFHQKLKSIAKRSIDSMSTANFLRAFQGQILVIHDHKDRVVPYSEAKTVADLSAARLFSTTGHGHGRILHADEVVEEIANFLNSSTIR